MNQSDTILFYRTNRKIKGLRPSIISLKKNIGKIYLEGQADFIMSLGKEEIFFQRLSLFTKKLIPQKDFSLSLARIKSFNLREETIVSNCLTLYTFEKQFIEIRYNKGTPSTYESETNVKELIKYLTSAGKKELK